ncbi:hypothetical protein ACP4OV_027318 [Aristida adscensionis]
MAGSSPVEGTRGPSGSQDKNVEQDAQVDPNIIENEEAWSQKCFQEEIASMLQDPALELVEDPAEGADKGEEAGTCRGGEGAAASPSTSFQEPEDPFAEVVRQDREERRRMREEGGLDPDYDPEADQEERMEIHNDAQEAAEAEVEMFESGPEPDTSTTTSAAKRKRGERSRNKFPLGYYVITEVNDVGEPLKPKENRAKLRNAIGAVVRDELHPAYKHWNHVPVGTKDSLWAKIQKHFKFPAGSEELVKHRVLKAMGESYRRWRSNLNVEYVQKGLTPFRLCSVAGDLIHMLDFSTPGLSDPLRATLIPVGD